MYSHVDLYKMLQNIANTLREQRAHPDIICAIALPNFVGVIVYFLAIEWIRAIATSFNVELRLDDVVRALKATNVTSHMPVRVDEVEATEGAQY